MVDNRESLEGQRAKAGKQFAMKRRGEEAQMPAELREVKFCSVFASFPAIK